MAPNCSLLYQTWMDWYRWQRCARFLPDVSLAPRHLILPEAEYRHRIPFPYPSRYCTAPILAGHCRSRAGNLSPHWPAIDFASDTSATTVYSRECRAAHIVIERLTVIRKRLVLSGITPLPGFADGNTEVGLPRYRNHTRRTPAVYSGSHGRPVSRTGHASPPTSTTTPAPSWPSTTGEQTFRIITGSV